MGRWVLGRVEAGMHGKGSVSGAAMVVGFREYVTLVFAWHEYHVHVKW